MKLARHIIICFCMLSIAAGAQKDSVLNDFTLSKHKLNRRGMVVLSYWGGANLVAGGAGYFASTNYESKSFYGMTSAWGLINLSIGLPGALSNKIKKQSLFQLQKEQTKVEKIYLSNLMFDLLYISGGAFCKEYAINQTRQRNYQMFNGFGDAILVQGIALLAFDTSMLLLNNRNRKKHLDPFLEHAQICIGPGAFRLRYQF